MKIKGSWASVKNLFANTKSMLALAWEMDPKVTFMYYLTAGVGAFAPIASSITLKYLIDYLQQYQHLTATVPTILIVVLGARYAAILAGDLIQYGLADTYYDFLFRYKLQNEFVRRLSNKLIHLDVAHLENPETQNLITKAKDTVAWRPPDFLRWIRYSFEALVGFVASIIVLIPFGWWIPVVITVISLPRLFFRIRYGSLEWSTYESRAPEVKKLYHMQYLSSHPPAIREIRVFQTQGQLMKRFIAIQEYLLATHKKPLDNYLKFLLAPSVLETAILFILAALFLPGTLTGAITIGSFSLIINMIDQVNSSANRLTGNLSYLYEQNLYVQYYLDTMNLPQLIKEDENPIDLDTSKPPLIEFKNVSFAYNVGRPILKNVSFAVKPGESIALVGVNGAGKSTIIKLMCRFYDVNEGEILINGVNIKKVKLNELYKFLGTLFQDFVQYHFTVRENIMLGDFDFANEERMKRAAKLAGIDEFIETLPDKYEQILGREFENGEELSGGQWQKLAIARAFYESAPVLILDEPTSAIDAEGEYEIFNNLEKHYTNKSLIFVSHRFSTVRNAHKIFVIDRGKVIESGSHQQLMKKNGKYARMFKMQAEGYQ